MEELVEYRLHDVDGKVYCVFVPQREANLLDLYQNKQNRLLEKLKTESQPVGKWDVSTEQEGATSSPSIYVPQTPAQTSKKDKVSKHYVHDPHAPDLIRATGKCGGAWDNDTVNHLVNNCLPFRKWLRQVHVPNKIWQKISDQLLFEHKLNYSWEQCKEKMRLLKQKFEKAKKGQLKGDQWPNFYLFVYLYDEALVDGHTTLAPEGFLLDDIPSDTVKKTVMEFNNVASPQGNNNIEDALGNNNIEVALGNNNIEDALGNNNIEDALGKNNIEDAPLEGALNDTVFQTVNLSFNSSQIMSSTTCEEEPGVAGTHTLVEDLCHDGIETLCVNDVPVSVVIATTKQQPQMKSPPKNPKCITAPTNLKTQIDINSLLRSPAPKKGKGVFSLPVRSPIKTPKRKTTKRDLHWEAHDVDTFVALCYGNKDILMQHPGTMPVETCKELAASLESMQIKKTWQTCRDKFSQMFTFFRSVLPTEGKVGENIWPYYSSFCTIMDIPENYHALLNDRDLPELDDEESKRLWTPNRQKLLIALFKAKSKSFFNSKSLMRYDVMWAEISQQMADFKHDISWQQCKSHFSTLKQRFNEEYDGQKKTGAAPSTWEFYNEMYAIYGGTATLDPPYLVSAGMRLTSHVKGKQEDNVQRNSRTRPQSHRSGSSSTSTKESRSTSNKYSSKPGGYSVLQIQERKLDQTERMITEVQKIRTNLERSAAMRKLVYKELLGKNRHAALFPEEEDDTDNEWQTLGD